MGVAYMLRDQNEYTSQTSPREKVHTLSKRFLLSLRGVPTCVPARGALRAQVVCRIVKAKPYWNRINVMVGDWAIRMFTYAHGEYLCRQNLKSWVAYVDRESPKVSCHTSLVRSMMDIAGGTSDQGGLHAFRETSDPSFLLERVSEDSIVL